MIRQLTRHRMELQLETLPRPELLPEGYLWVPWDDELLPVCAEVHYQSFRDEMDAELFSSFQTRDGCVGLWEEVRWMQRFLPECTWLIANEAGCCATIQCVAVSPTCGGIQNIAVLPGCRKLGLGRAMVVRALSAFQQHGFKKVTLEVTEQNIPAYHLYSALGFHKVATSYKTVS